MHEQHHDGTKGCPSLRARTRWPIEYARILNYGNEYHHAYQHAQRAEVDVLDSRYQTAGYCRMSSNMAPASAATVRWTFSDHQREHHNEDHY